MSDICAKSGGCNCQRDYDEDYDGTGCACVACPNVKLCGAWMPSAYLANHRGTCVNCAVSWGKALIFVAMTEECSICYNHPEEGVRHPSECAGKHTFCIPCIKLMYWGPEDNDEENTFTPHVTCPLCRKEFIPDWLKRCTTGSS